MEDRNLSHNCLSEVRRTSEWNLALWIRWWSLEEAKHCQINWRCLDLDSSKRSLKLYCELLWYLEFLLPVFSSYSYRILENYLSSSSLGTSYKANHRLCSTVVVFLYKRLKKIEMRVFSIKQNRKQNSALNQHPLRQTQLPFWRSREYDLRELNSDLPLPKLYLG